MNIKKIFGIGVTLLLILLMLTPIIGSLSLEIKEKTKEENIKEIMRGIIKKHHEQYMQDYEKLKFIEYTSESDIGIDPYSVFYSSDYAIVKLTKIGQLAKIILKTGCTPVDSITELNCVLFKMKSGMTVDEFIGLVEPMVDVEWAEINAMCSNCWTPNDPYFDQQWGLKAINCPAAWDKTKGESIVVAVIDSGYDWEHPDLLKVSGVKLGPDYVNNDDSPMDDFGHGTHCTGIVGAIMNNNVGISGITKTAPMVIKVLNNEGGGNNWNIAKGIVYAGKNGARVISMSLGGPYPSLLLDLACIWAFCAPQCVLLVAAAGNDGKNLPAFPARFRVVVSVGAVDENLKLCSWSNRNADFAAPGVDTFSTMPTYEVTMNGYPWYLNKNYDFCSGTSMAAPHVAGVAALIFSIFTSANPSTVIGILALTAKRRISGVKYGLINAANAVKNSINSNQQVNLQQDRNPSSFIYSHTQMQKLPLLFNYLIFSFIKKLINN